MDTTTATIAVIFFNKMPAPQAIAEASHPILNHSLTAVIASKGAATTAWCWTEWTLEMYSGKQSQMKWRPLEGRRDKIVSGSEDPDQHLVWYFSIYLLLLVKIHFSKIEIHKFLKSFFLHAWNQNVSNTVISMRSVYVCRGIFPCQFYGAAQCIKYYGSPVLQYISAANCS